MRRASTSWILLFVLAVPPILAGCDSGPLDRAPPGHLTGAPASAAPAPSASQAAGFAGVLRLEGGASLKLPADAKPRKSPASLPPEVLKSHHFQLASSVERLLITEMKLAQSCAKQLDQEWAKMQSAAVEKDPERLAVRRVKRVEDLKVGGHRVLFGAGNQSAKQGQEQQSASFVSAMMCAGKNYLVLMYASQKGRAPAKVRKLLLDIAGSYRTKR